MSASFGAWAKLATFTCSSISSWMRSSMSAASARRLTPNGLLVRCRTCVMARRSWSKSMVALASSPRPPAAAVAAVSPAPETQPMPVCTIGYSTPITSQNRV